MSVKKILVFTTWLKSTPASVKMALMFSITCRVSVFISSITSSPLTGFMGICPETNKRPPAITAWLYGPIGAGALLVLIIVFIIFLLKKCFHPCLPAGRFHLSPYIFFINIHSSNFQIIPAKKTVMAMALMACITLRLKLVGLFGSFLRKKYIVQPFLNFLNKFTQTTR